MNIKLPEQVKFVLQRLHKNGYKAYLVGGAVRNSVLQIPVKDWDICTSATPDEVMTVFRDKKIIATGLKHGTVTVMIYQPNVMPIEITTFRIDGEYSDNRRPDKVEFTSDLKEDLKRRDFTINAIAYNEEEGFVDPFNGLEDIKNKIIRCVGSPEERFKEDALRMLRALRFSTQLNFEIAKDTWLEIEKQYPNLANISMERINSEFSKIIVSSQAPNMLSKSSVFAFIIPELKDMIGFQQNNPYHIYDVYEHTIQALKSCQSNDFIVRLAILFHDIGKPHCYQDDENGIRHFKGHGKISSEMTDFIMRRMKFDNDTREKVVQLVLYHDSTFEESKKTIKRWLNKMDEEQFRRLLIVRRADIKGQNPVYEKERIEKVERMEQLLQEVLEENECFSLKDLAVNGKDLIQIGYKPGKEIGFALNVLLEKVISDELKNEKEELLGFAGKEIRKSLVELEKEIENTKELIEAFGGRRKHGKF